MGNPRLLVDISSHGFGHFAQSAPILNQLQHLIPTLELIVCCGLPTKRLRTRLQGEWQHIQTSSDFGFVMKDASHINHAETAERYRAFHAGWQERLAESTKILETLKPDLVLTNVAYLPLAAAHQTGIPSLSMSSLNWADLFGHFYGNTSWGRPIHAQILSAYCQAKCFARLTPAMPMEAFPNKVDMPPVASQGSDIRQLFLQDTGLAEPCRLVLAAFGGFDKQVDISKWPQIKNVHWIVPASWQASRSDMSSLDSCNFAFADLVRSVDAVLTKPGYGTFTEATCNGTSVLYVPREDWPEQDCLIEWLHQHARCQAVSETDLLNGKLEDALSVLWSKPEHPYPVQDGSRKVAEWIAAHLLL